MFLDRLKKPQTSKASTTMHAQSGAVLVSTNFASPDKAGMGCRCSSVVWPLECNV